MTDRDSILLDHDHIWISKHLIEVIKQHFDCFKINRRAREKLNRNRKGSVRSRRMKLPYSRAKCTVVIKTSSLFVWFIHTVGHMIAFHLHIYIHIMIFHHTLSSTMTVGRPMGHIFCLFLSHTRLVLLTHACPLTRAWNDNLIVVLLM